MNPFPPKISLSAARNFPNHSGFVLVAVLLLIAQVTVLVSATCIHSQIERRAASNSAKTEQARQNALFALNAALGQLQKEAGPDQRITARAEILDSDPTTTAIDNVGQPYWTGVWKTGTASLDMVNSGTSQRGTSLGSVAPTVAQKASNAVWLVSNPNSNSALNPTAVLASGTGAVVLARSGSSSVIVPLVPLVIGSNAGSLPAGTIRGKYGYWVSDEGIKAKVNIKDPTLASTSQAINQLHFAAPQATDIRKGVLGASNTAEVRDQNDLAKVNSLQSMGLLPGMNASSLAGTAASAFFPDATTSSFGVLSDVRNGGLKKDLTAGLESSGTFSTLSSTFGYGASMLYRYAISAGLTIPLGDQSAKVGVTDGLPWYSLYFHYNAYKGQTPAPVATTGSPTVAPTSSGNPVNLPNVLSPRSYGVKLADVNNVNYSIKLGGILPQPIALRVDVAISSYNANPGAGAADWRLRLHYYPQLVLYNPYSVRISVPDYQFSRGMQAFVNGSVVNRMTITSTTGGVNTVWPPFLISQVSRLNLKTKLGECATLDPGETRVFGLDADASKSMPSDAITFSNLVSNANMSPDFSQYCDVSTTVDANGNNTAPLTPFSTSDPNTVIMVDLASRELNCGAIDTYCSPSKYKWPDNDGNLPVQTGGSYDQAAAAASWPSLTISQMSGAPRRIIGFYIRQKGLLPSSSTYSYANAAAQIPIFHGNHSDFSSMEDITACFWKEVYLSPLGSLYQNGQTDVQIAHPLGSTQFWETSFGSQSTGVGAPGNRYILRDVPSQPLVSLGQFMHMPALNFFQNIVNAGTSYGFLAPGSMFVGGSLASPVIPTEQNALISPLALYLDNSFLANQALFDRFYFSTVPPASLSAASTTYPAYWTAFNAANSGSTLADGTKPLLNNRLKPYYKNGTAPQMASLRDVDKAAANLMLEGAFNVNSTSVNAWKALLSSLSGNDLKLWNASSGVLASLTSGSLTNPIPRFWSASFRGGINQPWEGMRCLSDAELTELATRIVEQVKTRGPFLSMADFLNRRLGTNTALTRTGALQAAIDNTSPDINAKVKLSGTTVNVSGGPVGAVPIFAPNLQDAKGNALNTTVGMPGYLMQQDLVQAFSPVMTVRSDTFLIRCYGEYNNPKNAATEGQAWGEAVVQRLPDFVDQNDPAVKTLGDSCPLASLNSNNQTLGRRFKILSFRWLNETDL